MAEHGLGSQAGTEELQHAPPCKRQRQVKTREDAAQPEDLHHWHKYGQKAVGGSTCTRAYFRCAQKAAGCLAKRLVDREHGAMRVTYVGEHSHPPPCQPVRKVVFYSASGGRGGPAELGEAPGRAGWCHAASSSSESAVEREGGEVRSPAPGNPQATERALVATEGRQGPGPGGGGGGFCLGLGRNHPSVDPRFDAYRQMMTAAAAAPSFAWENARAAGFHPAMRPQEAGMGGLPAFGNVQAQLAGLGVAGLAADGQMGLWALSSGQPWAPGWSMGMGQAALHPPQVQLPGDARTAAAVSGAYRAAGISRGLPGLPSGAIFAAGAGPEVDPEVIARMQGADAYGAMARMQGQVPHMNYPFYGHFAVGSAEQMPVSNKPELAVVGDKRKFPTACLSPAADVEEGEGFYDPAIDKG